MQQRIVGNVDGHSPTDRGRIVLRLAIITSTFPFGSAEAFLYAELDRLAQLGCNLTIFPAVPRGKRNTHPDLCADVVRFSLLSAGTLYHALLGLRRNPRGAFHALRTILQSRNRLWTKLKNLALFPTGLAVANTICVRHLHHVHAHWLSGPSTVALIASRVAGVEWSYTAHSGDIFLENNLIAEKTKSAKFGRVISEFGREGIVHQSGVNVDHLNVIHLGVNIPTLPATLNAERLNRISLLCPAYFYHFKDHATLLEALRVVVDAGFGCDCVFAGNGPLRASVARQIKALHLQSVVSMPGVIPHKELLQRLQSGAYDAVVLASQDLEGIPVSLIEAMAAGIPCIATRTGAIAELIQSDCGILVEQRDFRGMAQAIMALASDPEHRKELGERARLRVAQAFGVQASASSLVELILAGSLN